MAGRPRGSMLQRIVNPSRQELSHVHLIHRPSGLLPAGRRLRPAGRRLPGHRHAHARHRRGQHGRVAHRLRPALELHRAAMGHRRLHAEPGHRRAQLRLAGRPRRPPPHLRRRDGRLHPLLAGLRAGRIDPRPRRGPRRAGHRGRRHVRHLAGDPVGRLPRAGRARDGVRRLRRGHRRLLRRRPADRRRADQRLRLALRIPRQRAPRRARPAGHPPLGARVTQPVAPPPRLAGAADPRRRDVPAGPRTPAGQRRRMGHAADRRRAGRRSLRAPRLRGHRAPLAGADAAARAVPLARVRRHPGHGVRHLGVVLRHVPVHHPLRAGGTALLADPDRPHLPAVHGRDLPRLGSGGPAGPARRPGPADRRRTGSGGGRAGAHEPHGRRGLVVDGDPPRVRARRRRLRAVQPGGQRARPQLRAGGAQRPGLRDQRHVSPERDPAGGGHLRRARAGGGGHRTRFAGGLRGRLSSRAVAGCALAGLGALGGARLLGLRLVAPPYPEAASRAPATSASSLA